jgi:hypothetical protein
MALGDGVERAVAQAHDAVVVLVGLVAALAQDLLDVRRCGGGGGDLAAERLGGAAQGTPRSPVLVMRRGVREQSRREAVVARWDADRELALGALVELRGPPAPGPVRPDRLA